MTRPLRGRAARSAAVLVTLVALLLAGLVGTSGRAAAATVPSPRTPTGLAAAIESLAPYVPQVACDPRIGTGTRNLATLLTNTYRSTTRTSWASFYACGTDGSRSEHYDGRAIDWMVSVTNPAQRAAATATIAWLLATDAHGNRFAMARRLGVMYLIWDNRMWGAWDGRWEDYNGCQAAAMQKTAYANSCHRTHIHISLSWAGAKGSTSFWTHRVAPTDYGPCRPADLNWASLYVHANTGGCPRVASVAAPKGASALKRSLVRWSGIWLFASSSGPAVAPVQQALHIATSTAYGARTAAAVSRFQRAHHLPVNGVMTPVTWRALLAATR